MTYTSKDAELAFGPANTASNLKLKGEFEARVGVELTVIQWAHLAEGCRRAGNLFLWKSPHSPESRKRLERLRLASIECARALQDVKVQQEQEWIDPRDPPAETLLSVELIGAIDAADEHILDDEEIISEAHRLISIISSACEEASKQIRAPARGKGRKTTGYDEFLDTCRTVWASKFGEEYKGYSTTAGRGSGPFVRFVGVAEALLPRLMWRESAEKIGDAIVRRFEGNRTKRDSVTGNTKAFH